MTTTVHVEISVAPRSGAAGPESANPLLFSYAGTGLPDGNIGLTTIKDDAVLEFELATGTPANPWRKVHRDPQINDGGNPNIINQSRVYPRLAGCRSRHDSRSCTDHGAQPLPFMKATRIQFGRR